MNHASITHDIMPGIQFRSPRHANPVIWTVDHYHRNGCYVCEEAQHNTTCEFHYDEIMANLVEEHREPDAKANARAHRNPFVARRSPFYAFEKPLNPSKPITPRNK
jgi:hypothetical protein